MPPRGKLRCFRRLAPRRLSELSCRSMSWLVLDLLESAMTCAIDFSSEHRLHEMLLTCPTRSPSQPQHLPREQIMNGCEEAEKAAALLGRKEDDKVTSPSSLSKVCAEISGSNELRAAPPGDLSTTSLVSASLCFSGRGTLGQTP